MGFCKKRVWGNGDHDDCGVATLPGHSFCIDHRVQELRRLQRELADTQRALLALETEYNRLLREGQPQ